LKQGSTFTIKIATGFWKNPERGLASSNGVVLVFSSETGELLTIFQDEGYLTDMRTAAAGAVAAKYSIADLTGVAVQDMAIAELALQGLRSA
jgi:ornithine cyclodeaminase